MIKAVIFDMDGLMLDTERLTIPLWDEAGKKFGYSIPFDIDWRDPGNYHLSINTGIFRPADCAEIINQFKARFLSPESEAQSAARLKDHILEQRIKHCIRYERGIPVHFLEASVSGGSITLHGVANSQALVDTALDAVKTAGLADDPSNIRNEIQIVREYSVMS